LTSYPVAYSTGIYCHRSGCFIFPIIGLIWSRSV